MILLVLPVAVVLVLGLVAVYGFTVILLNGPPVQHQHQRLQQVRQRSLG